jgi:DNA-binding response OmpR family regulator
MRYNRETGGRNLLLEQVQSVTTQDQPESTRTHWILVVDDEPHVRDLVVRFLQTRGYGVEAVESGEEALEAVGRKKFDLMILDSRMPGLSGGEVIEKLQAVAEDRRPKVILLTGRITGRIQIGETHAVRVVDVLRKPFDLKVLDQVVRGALDL